MTTIELDPTLFLPEPEPRAVTLHDHLGRRPPRRAAAHVRGPAAREAPGPRAAHRRDRAGPRGLGVRGPAPLPGRPERGRRPPQGDGEGRAVPLRADAPGLLRPRRPHPRHGHQRRLGVAELPVDDHRLLRPRVLAGAPTPSSGSATTRAWNDWFFEEWYSPYPERIIPLGITWLADPEIGAEEIRRNAARGFRAVTLPERPHRIGFPSIFDRLLGADHRARAPRPTPSSACTSARRAWPTYPEGAPPLAARRHAVRPAVADGVRGVAVVGAGRCATRT